VHRRKTAAHAVHASRLACAGAEVTVAEAVGKCKVDSSKDSRFAESVTNDVVSVELFVAEINVKLTEKGSWLGRRTMTLMVCALWCSGSRGESLTEGLWESRHDDHGRIVEAQSRSGTMLQWCP